MPIKKPVNQNVVKAGGKYVIPKKRRVIKKIQINGGVLTAEVPQDVKKNESSEIYWFRNGRYITPAVRSKYKFYDKKTGLNIKLNKYKYTNHDEDDERTGLNPDTPYIKQIADKAEHYGRYYGDQNFNQRIPFDENTYWLTLRTKNKNGKPGITNLVDVPINMLDSIAVNAGRSNTDFWTDLALVGKESTLGGFSDILYHNRPTGHYITPSDLVNNHAFTDSPYSDYLAQMHKDYPLMTDSPFSDVAKIEQNAKHAIKHGTMGQKTPRYSNYLLADAFKRYAVNPYKYNPGQKNYVPMLNDIRNELSGEKQLQIYWDAIGQRQYDIGRREGISKPVFE